MKSWRKQVAVLLTLILVIVLAFLGWLVFSFNRQYSDILRRENESDLALWMGTAEQRLNAVHNNVYEILLNIYRKAATAPGSGSLPVSLSVETQEMMQNLLLINPDPDCYFLLDSDSGKLLFSASNTRKSSSILELKAFVGSLDPADARSVSDKNWTIHTIGDDVCFLCHIHTGKYTAGAVCHARIFNDIGSASLFPDETSLYLAWPGGQALAVHGNTDPDTARAGGWQSLLRRSSDLVMDFPLLGCQAVLVRNTPPLLSRWGSFFLLLAVIIVVLTLIALVSLVILRKVAEPTRKLIRAQDQIAAGNLDYRITDRPGSSEFETLYHSFNDMADQIRTLRIASYDNRLKEEENKFRMVRAQIRPHFYLNSITVIHNMTYQNRLEDIRSYVQALARHIRYMLNIQSPMIAVSSELAHIRNYIKMQDLRFPGSVQADYVCDEAVGGTEIPFLMLFTVVENSFKHAMNLYSTMELRIICEPYSGEGFSGMRMIVEDNGDGYTPDVLAHFSGPMPEELPTKDHLGLSNVQYTLRYVYGRDGLLRLSNLEHGARTEILIPGEVKRIETADL